MTIFQPNLEGLGYVHASPSWLLTKDGDPRVYALTRTHYSTVRYRVQRQRLFIGPGEKLVLVHASGLAAFGWRKFLDASGQQGVNNCLFISHGAGLSSQLILEAEAIAWARWPGERLYTYVNPRKVRSSNPGCCYKKAGWVKAGHTKGGLLVLEKRPR